MAKDTTLKTKEERAKAKADRNLSDIRHIAKDAEGRRFLWRLMEENGIFQSGFNADALVMSHSLGRKTAGLSVLSDVMTAKPSLFSQMQQEHASEIKREKIIIQTEEEQSDALSLD